MRPRILISSQNKFLFSSSHIHRWRFFGHRETENTNSLLFLPLRLLRNSSFWEQLSGCIHSVIFIRQLKDLNVTSLALCMCEKSDLSQWFCSQTTSNAGSYFLHKQSGSLIAFLHYWVCQFMALFTLIVPCNSWNCTSTKRAQMSVPGNFVSMMASQMLWGCY